MKGHTLCFRCARRGKPSMLRMAVLRLRWCGYGADRSCWWLALAPGATGFGRGRDRSTGKSLVNRTSNATHRCAEHGRQHVRRTARGQQGQPKMKKSRKPGHNSRPGQTPRYPDKSPDPDKVSTRTNTPIGNCVCVWGVVTLCKRGTLYQDL